MERVYHIVGSGSLGTANAQARSKRPDIDKIRIYTRNEKILSGINNSHENPVYFSGVRLSPKIEAVQLNFQELGKAEGIIELDIPGSGLNEFINGFRPYYNGQAIVFTTKGMVLREKQPMFPDEAIRHGLGKETPIVFLCSPAFAKSVIKENSTFHIIASSDYFLAAMAAQAIKTDSYRIVEKSEDVIGLEIIAVMKNIGAISLGIADSVGLPMSSKVGISYECRQETLLLIEALGGRRETLLGLANEDFWLTGFGEEGRNRQFGKNLDRENSKKRFRVQSATRALLKRWRKRKRVDFLERAGEAYQEIFVSGLVHDFLASPVIVSRILNTLAISSSPEEPEGSFAIPLLLEKGAVLGLEKRLPLVMETNKVVFGGELGEIAIHNILDAISKK